MDSFIDMIEKNGENFYKQLKQVGLIRWRFNRVWNKKGIFEISESREFKITSIFDIFFISISS